VLLVGTSALFDQRSTGAHCGVFGWCFLKEIASQRLEFCPCGRRGLCEGHFWRTLSVLCETELLRLESEPTVPEHGRAWSLQADPNIVLRLCHKRRLSPISLICPHSSTCAGIDKFRPGRQCSIEHLPINCGVSRG
jgi:hypothetical protein